MSSLQRVDVWQLENNRFAYITTLPPSSEDNFPISGIAFSDGGLLNITKNRNYETRFDTWNVQVGEQITSTVLPQEECTSSGNVVPNPVIAQPGKNRECPESAL